MSIDEVACRLDRIQKNSKHAHALVQALKDSILTNVGSCLTSSVGIAANRLLAKLASNMQKPNGLTLLPNETLPGTILHLSFRELSGIGHQIQERLHQVGIRSMKDLWEA